MAKVSFTKLGLSKDKLNEIKTIDFNGQVIEIRQYLPINEKLEMVSRIINKSADENNFANPVKLDIFLSLSIVENYTNISFTEKQKEDTCKLYDLLKSNGIIDMVINTIPVNEYTLLYEGLYNCADAVYKYRNSILGILETVSQDYSNLNLDATNIQ